MEWGQLCHCEGSTKKKLEWETKMEHEKIKNKNYEKVILKIMIEIRELQTQI